MDRDVRWVFDFDSFLVAEQIFALDRAPVYLLAVEGKLALPLYFINGSRRRKVSITVDDSSLDWVSFAKRSHVQL